MANISQWAHYFAGIYRKTAIESLELNCTIVKHTQCDSDDLVKNIKLYFTPIKMEYFLLSMVFIAELWPSNESHVHEVSVERTNSGSEYAPLLSSSYRRIHRWGFYNRRTMLSVVFVTLMVVPCYVFGYLKHSTERGKGHYNMKFQNADVAYDIFLSFSKTVLVVISFDMISKSTSYFKPFMRTQYLHFHHKMIIASFLGSIAYCS